MKEWDGSISNVALSWALIPEPNAMLDWKIYSLTHINALVFLSQSCIQSTLGALFAYHFTKSHYI